MSTSTIVYPVKHDKKLTDEMLKTYYVSKVHAAGIKLRLEQVEALQNVKIKYPLHYRITVECKPKDKTKSAKGTSGSKAQKKGERSSNSPDSKSKAQTKEEQKSIFIAIDTNTLKEDVKKNNWKKNVPSQMITELKSYAHSNKSPEDTRLTFMLKESKKDEMSASKLFKWFEKKGHLRYKSDEDGKGCAFYVKRLITDMGEDDWFDSSDNTTNESFKILNSFKKNALFGEDCYMEYGEGTFY